MLVFAARSRSLANVDVVIAGGKDQVHIVARGIPGCVPREGAEVLGRKGEGSAEHTGSGGMARLTAREAEEHTGNGEKSSPRHGSGMGASPIGIMPHDNRAQRMKPCVDMAGFKGNHTGGNAR